MIADPLEVLHRRLLALTVTPSAHDPVATLVDVTSVLRDEATDALTRSTSAERWTAVADVLSTAGAVYRDLARRRPAVQLSCPVCALAIGPFPTVQQAQCALQAHAANGHTTPPRLPLRTSPFADPAWCALALLDHLLKAAVHDLLSGRDALLDPIRHHVIRLEPVLADLAPRAVALTHPPHDPDRLVDALLAADRQLRSAVSGLDRAGR
ncbi:MAG TPA: hypothetical protein VGP26_29895 [Actinophytocola sp.]|jgi:hypothetical protein|nr:hypothetical protein [Actinophytocola sp.]